jgi:hypothetical protein
MIEGYLVSRGISLFSILLAGEELDLRERIGSQVLHDILEIHGNQPPATAEQQR